MGQKAKLIWNELTVYIYITIGLVIYGTGVTLFMLPYEVTSGGVTGVASLIYFATGFEVQYSYLIINAFLLLAAIKILGWKFCVKTIYGVFFLTFYMWLLQRIVLDADGNLPRLVQDQTFMAVVLGAVFEGVGLSLCFSHDGSTGGTDIIAAIVHKYKDISLGQVIMLCDFIIISSSYFIFVDKYGNETIAWQKIVFGYVTFIIAGVTLDYSLNRTKQSVQIMVFSRNYRKIADAINSTGRGVTVLDGEGWYTKTERKVVVTLVRKTEANRIFQMIKSVDPYCFVSMANVQGVYGEGFDPMKAKIKQTKPTLVFATNNEHKLEEVRKMVGDKFEIRSLDDINCRMELPETSDTLEGNAMQKAEFVKRYYGFDCFADDTGLECTALGGEPGVHTARYATDGHDNEANMNKLLANLEGEDDRSAQFRTSIALIYKGEKYTFEGIVKGHIATERHGNEGFGYDPIFIPEGHDETFAQLGADIKNNISHRARAVGKLCDFLKKNIR